VTRYRYRTCAILGPWRSSPDEAAADAVKARQARWDDNEENLCWLVPGEIEKDHRAAA
jgi:hypothetical protein